MSSSVTCQMSRKFSKRENFQNHCILDQKEILGNIRQYFLKYVCSSNISQKYTGFLLKPGTHLRPAVLLGA